MTATIICMFRNQHIELSTYHNIPTQFISSQQLVDVKCQTLTNILSQSLKSQSKGLGT